MAVRQNLAPWAAWIPVPEHKILSALTVPREKAMGPSAGKSSWAPAKLGHTLLATLPHIHHQAAFILAEGRSW